MLSFEDLMKKLQDCVLKDEHTREDVDQKLLLFVDKLSETSRSSVKRCKERCLEEAAQLLRTLSDVEDHHLQLLVRLLICLQLEMVSISTACRKVDQMLQHLAKVDRQLVYRETHNCLYSTVHAEQMLSFEDLQRACMFLEDSNVGREVWRDMWSSFVGKVAELFPHLLRQQSLGDGPLCYLAVKVCLQIFQLLSADVSPSVWDKEKKSPALQNILQALMDVILGQSCTRDTRLLAGTAVAMVIDSAPESRAGGAAAWSLLQVSHAEPWLLTIGTLQVWCSPSGEDGVQRLAVSRGLLTCCRPNILLTSRVDAPECCILLDGLFPVVCALCQGKLDSSSFEVLALWLKKVKECVAGIWRTTGVRLLSDNSSLLQQLIHIIWTNADNPVEGVSEFVHSALCLLLDLYHMDCEQFGDSQKTLYFTLLQRVVKLPWEAKAKYQHLCALLPYVGTDVVMNQHAEIPNHLLKCLSSNHLSPCGSDLYKCLIQQQRRELCESSQDSAAVTELDLAGRWAARWRAALLEALTSDVTLLQSNSSTHLLPCTFQVFPSAVEPLLASLGPFTPGHLRAWACIISSYRATTGASPWALRGHATLHTLRLALGSADEKVRLAALNLLCCSPKTKDSPTVEEMSIMRTFIPQNLNCESSLFRQHFQAGVKRFLARIRDGCLAQIKGQKARKGEATLTGGAQESLDQGIGFVEWLSQLPFCSLAPGHSYQRKKTALLLLSAVLETCTDTWRPDKKKGQPPVNTGSLVQCARLRGQWDFFSRTKLLVLISCLEDSTNEIRELSAGLLVGFFPSSLPADVAAVLRSRAKQLLCSPRVQQAQMGALMMKVLLQKTQDQSEDGGLRRTSPPGAGSSFVGVLVQELEEHYLTAKADMMLAARTKPLHGVLSALQRCLLEVTSSVCHVLSHTVLTGLLGLLEDVSLLLLRVLHGDQDRGAADLAAPPSFCDMGNAISSLVAQTSGGDPGDADECVLLSEEHSLVLTCCWVSLKETGIFVGSLVERVLSESKPSTWFLTKEDLTRASNIFRNILLKCRHWGAVEGCCVGFTRFCVSLLTSTDPELRDIPAHMLEQGLQVLQSPSSTSVTRRAAGLPMLILCIVSAEEAGKSRPLLVRSMQSLLETARAPLPESWDQTLDLPQVCAVHTLQALVRGSGLGAAVLHFAPAVAVLSLTLLSSPCWAMRNAALQLYSSLCSRMLGQRLSNEERSMSPPAFFCHYSELQPFLLAELRAAARDLQTPAEEARLRLQPSLYPILTLLAQLQPGVQDSTDMLKDFLAPLLQLSASPIYSVRVMASKALVAMTPPSEYMNILIKLTERLVNAPERCCHNQLHGQLLQIRALLDGTVNTDSAPSDDLRVVCHRVDGSLWLATRAQRCPLVRAAYLAVVESLRSFCCGAHLSKLCEILSCELQTQPQGLQVGLSSFHQQAIQFLCADERWACHLWDNFSTAGSDLRLALVTWVVGGRAAQHSSSTEVIQRALQSNLRGALLSDIEEYRRTYLAALVAVMSGGNGPSPQLLQESSLSECVDLLLGDLEEQSGGPEFLSQALNAASLLLSQCKGSDKNCIIQRWCGVLETQRRPEAAEVLRLASADALCVAAVPLMSRGMMEHSGRSTAVIRLVDSSLHLLQDQSPAVRGRAARFISMVQHARVGNQGSVHLIQVNQAIPCLLDLLLEECWDAPGALEVLLAHLPQPDLRSVLRESSDLGCAGLYEQDDANVFMEPSVMSAYVLPYLLQMAERQAESRVLARSLSTWAERDAALVLRSLAACQQLQTGEKTLTEAWLALLLDPCFHSTLCGLFTRAAVLLRLVKTSADLRHLCDPSDLQRNVQDVCRLLSEKGVHFPSALAAAVAGDGPR